MFVTVGSVTLHGRVDGDAPGRDVVFIHSLGSDLRIWDGVVDDLAAAFRCWRYDLRGHGLSDVPDDGYALADHAADALGFMDRFGLERVALAGISVGGLVAMDVARQAPNRVDALILCDSAARIGTAQGWSERIQAVTEQGLPALADDLAPAWFAPGFVHREPSTISGHINMLARTPTRGYLGTCAALRDADLADALGAISSPALVLCGDRDVSTPPAAGRALAAALSRGSFAVVADAGHLPCVERPAAVAGLIRDFLQEVAMTEPEARESGEHEIGEWGTRERGMAVRRQVLGNDHVDRAEAARTPLDTDFQDFITRYAWGEVWSRGALDRRERHLLTLAVLCALGREHELALHLRATRNTGVSPADVAEVFQHVAVYAGLPVANSAFALAKDILGDDGPGDAP